MKLYWERKSKSLLYIKTSNSVIDQAVQANNIKAMLTQSVSTEIMFWHWQTQTLNHWEPLDQTIKIWLALHHILIHSHTVHTDSDSYIPMQQFICIKFDRQPSMHVPVVFGLFAVFLFSFFFPTYPFFCQIRESFFCLFVLFCFIYIIIFCYLPTNPIFSEAGHGNHTNK